MQCLWHGSRGRSTAQSRAASGISLCSISLSQAFPQISFYPQSLLIQTWSFPAWLCVPVLHVTWFSTHPAMGVCCLPALSTFHCQQKCLTSKLNLPVCMQFTWIGDLCKYTYIVSCVPCIHACKNVNINFQNLSKFVWIEGEARPGFY